MAKERKPKTDTTPLHSDSFRSAVHEVLYRYARDGDYTQLIDSSNWIESELP